MSSLSDLRIWREKKNHNLFGKSFLGLEVITQEASKFISVYNFDFDCRKLEKRNAFFFSSEFIVCTLTHECVLWYLSGEAKQIVFLKMEQDCCCRLKSKKVQFTEETCYFFGNFSISLEACGIFFLQKIIFVAPKVALFFLILNSLSYHDGISSWNFDQCQIYTSKLVYVKNILSGTSWNYIWRKRIIYFW